MPASAPQPPRPSPRKLLAFRIVTLGVMGALGLLATETLLRSQQARISRSDALDPGMVQYDARLGWRLEPGWKGQHKHHDFAASYAINRRGFRADTPFPPATAGRKLALVVGDSFTFGLGVNDDQTYAHLLNAAGPAGFAFLNCSIPGFSTDQQSLLLEGLLAEFKPDQVLLAVYVGNDVFDNELPRPLQVSSPKPYFEIAGDGLVLRNNPVPMGREVRTPGQGGLMNAVLGPDSSAWSLRTRLEQTSELLRLVAPALLDEKDYRAEFASRFSPALRLFGLLLDRINAECRKSGASLTLSTLAGRSFFQQPGSVSSQYQDYLLEQVVALCAARGIPVIDVARRMQERHPREGGDWFYSNDGHLTPNGHRVVSEILGAAWADAKR
jgi:hypothetical protein